MIRGLSVSATSAVAAVFLAIGGALAAGAQATPSGHAALPLTPVSQQSAVRKAQDYLSTMGFSRSGLINQLVSFEGFSSTDATFAVDSLTVDWNTQAARKAQDYLSTMGFSRSGLINQLVSFEGFTPAQAQYGVTAVGL